MKKIPVEGHNNLVRDTSTGAIININKKSLEDARRAKSHRLQEKSRIDRLESDIMQIKALLQQQVKNKND